MQVNNEDINADVDFSQALSQRYISYALSTIMSRSLPDVRDGLKPVHRRLLYAMQQLNLNPKSGFKKCARVVGDVIGKYHPHGDVAVYETLVRLAQYFSLRYPLIEGQGNFGSIDGDNAAAMRYTESRLTEIATYLLLELDQQTVDFKSTYDDQDQEPCLMPASFPNLLANGSEGIAVGMATSIPPHNLDELIEALINLIKNSNLSIEQLLDYIPGPDFPTGGIIVEEKINIINAYKTGRGSIRLRAKWHKEELPHGLYQIVITEIPYQVQKSKLIEKIADLFREKKLILLGNIRDESTEEIRLILEPKSRNFEAELLMESLFKLTDLEVRINLNMNVLNKDSIPKVMNLKQILQEFLDHRYLMTIRRSNYKITQLTSRLEILTGLMIAYLNIDKIIEIIRTEDEPGDILIQNWQLTKNQAEAILNMRLRSLRKLAESDIKFELTKLTNEKAELSKIVSNEKVCWRVITKELKIIQEKFGANTLIGKRRTNFDEAKNFDQASTIEAFIEKEPITIICSKMGWIRAIKSHNEDLPDIKYKEGDEEKFIIKAYTTDKLIIFSQTGKFYTIICDRIPKGKNHGEPLRLMIDLADDDQVIQMFIYQSSKVLLLASKAGRGFLINEDEVIAQTKLGKQIFNLTNDEALFCRVVTGDSVAIIGENRKLLIFKINELPMMRRGQGVILQKYKQAKLIDLKIFNYSEGLSWQLGDRVRSEAQLLPWLNKRGSIGKIPPVGFPKNNKFTQKT